MNIRHIITTVLGVLVVSGAVVATPAEAAPRVGLVQAVGVTSSSVTLSWPKYRKAASYRVVRASNYAFTKGVRTVRAKGAKVTVRGLRPGVEYCFKVRAYNRKGKHLATSARTCKPAAAVSVPARAVNVSTLTYNICSKACDTSADARRVGMRMWPQRRPVVTRTILGSGADVVALQESSGWVTVAADLAATYTAVPDFGYYRSSSLLFRSSRFEQVVDTVTYEDGDGEGETVTESTPRAATIDLGNGRRATWAELRDRRRRRGRTRAGEPRRPRCCARSTRRTPTARASCTWATSTRTSRAATRRTRPRA